MERLDKFSTLILMPDQQKGLIDDSIDGNAFANLRIKRQNAVRCDSDLSGCSTGLCEALDFQCIFRLG